MRAYGWLGLFLLLLSEYCLFKRAEPFYSWFYCLAWWSYILLADNLLLILSGRSLIHNRSRELWAMLPLSVFIWLIFEAYNLVIRNWAYDGIISNPWLRWPGYAAAFATVLPGIFITSDLVEHFFKRPAGERQAVAGDKNVASASECEPLTQSPSSEASPFYMLLGLALSAAPLLLPRWFFFAVWLGPIFLLDPLLERLGVRSLSLTIASGNRRRIWCLMAGGLICGGLWEFWNYWAASKWVYTVPFFAEWKVFEMPVAGFLGFPPFALECWILYHLITGIQRRWPSPAVRLAGWLVIGLFCIFLFRQIDLHTVVRFAAIPPRSAHPWLHGLL